MYARIRGGPLRPPHRDPKLYSYYNSKKTFLWKAQTEVTFYLFCYWSLYERVYRFQFKINLLKLIYTKICNKKVQSFVWGYRHDAGTKIYLYKDFNFLVCKFCKMENKYQNTYFSDTSLMIFHKIGIIWVVAPCSEVSSLEKIHFMLTQSGWFYQLSRSNWQKWFMLMHEIHNFNI